MNIFYINSGYIGIYSHFDLWIKEINSEQFEIIDIPISINQQIFKNMLQTSSPIFVLIMIGNKTPNHILKVIKETNIPLVVWFTEDPFYTDVSLEVLPYADYILSIDQSSCEFYRKLGYKNIHYFPLASNDRIFKPLKLEKEIDLLLIGYPYPNRIKLIQSIINSTNYSILLIGKSWNKYLKIPNQKKKNIQMISNWIPPYEVNLLYNKAKIILNPHRQSTFIFNKNSKNVINRSVNNRFFDIVLSGGFQLINEEIDSFVDEENERLTRYADDHHCIQLIQKYINEFSHREELVKELRTKMIGKNTFSNRLNTLLKILEYSSES
jgi:spore maturation protein CgeB